MYIKDEELRDAIKEILKTKTKNYIVSSIRKTGVKFQQYNLDNFMRGASVNIETLHKIEKFVLQNQS